MPMPSANTFGEYHKMGPRKAIGFMALVREMFAWHYRWADEAFTYHENTVTGDRKAVPRKGIRPRDATPRHEWLEAVR